jgi:hypothetical protein
MGQRVAGIDHLGSYACRNVNRGEGAPPNAPARARSRHATANALDISAFTLADGQRITVLKDWPAKTPPHRSAQGNAAARGPRRRLQILQGVLGPDYNAVHKDHFHLETGGYSMCR